MRKRPNDGYASIRLVRYRQSKPCGTIAPFHRDLDLTFGRRLRQHRLEIMIEIAV